MDIERILEEVQEGDVDPKVELLFKSQIDLVLDYLSFSSYKEGPKARKVATLEGLKTLVLYKHLVECLCTERFIYLLAEIKKNIHSKRISERIIELTYDVYAECTKSLLEHFPDETIQIIISTPGKSYLDIFIRCCDSNYIVDLFPCFFSISGNSFQSWIRYLVSKEVISTVFKALNKSSSAQKDTQSYTKLLYPLVSFTSGIFKKEFVTETTGVYYTYFYQEIVKRMPSLLDIIFIGTDCINRISALEVLKEMIKVTEYLSMDIDPLPFLYRYLKHSEILKQLQNNNQEPLTQIRIIVLLNTISRTIRFKSSALLEFLEETQLMSYSIKYLYTSNIHGITNEICSLLNEMIFVDKIFYVNTLLEICNTIQSLTLYPCIKSFSNSQRKGFPNASLIDCITPMIYTLHKLYEVCLKEATIKKNRTSDWKLSQNRFTIVDETIPSYKILQSLFFLQDESLHWYKSIRILEHKRRVSMGSIKYTPETLPNSEQFARYFCSYILSTLPECSEYLFN
ncbi:hypothetical protein NEOKW01_1034 [Nematocida sp. AWRm80]|nr:hypothetical protein NEOKW01_1034 [Nematocida sp. AWRm80]